MLAHRKRGRKGKKISGDGKYFFGGEGEGGKYLEIENFLLSRRRKTEKEKQENIWRRKLFSLWRKRKMFLEGKYLVCGGEENRRRKIFRRRKMSQWSGEPLFEMCCFHVGIARKGGRGVKACQDGLEHFFHVSPFDRGGGS